MRICPKCGYIENPLWQQDRFNKALMYMRWADFQNEYPEIARELGATKGDHHTELYIFRLTPSKKYVKRREKLFDDGQPFYPRYEGHAGEQHAHAMAMLTKNFNRRRKQSGKQTSLV